MNLRRIVTLVVLAVVLIGLGVLVASTVNLMPEEASVQAQMVDRLFRLLMGIATVIFVAVEGALVYAVVRFRRRAGDDTDGPAVHGSTTLEAVWTAIPALIVIVIAFVSFRVLAASAVREAEPVVVEVVGRQFTWEFRYPEADVASTELHLPVDRQVRFEITSDDVIHSLWIPEFRIKQDATPGRVAEMVITPRTLPKARSPKHSAIKSGTATAPPPTPRPNRKTKPKTAASQGVPKRQRTARAWRINPRQRIHRLSRRSARIPRLTRPTTLNPIASANAPAASFSNP